METPKNDYSQKEYWNERFKIYGHTGTNDPLLYFYDQRYRIWAIIKALKYCGIPICNATRILDIGCGTGDLIEELSKYDSPIITGTDISNLTIQNALKRFEAKKNISFVMSDIQKLPFIYNMFDLVAGINVLQHVVKDSCFLETISGIKNVLKQNGYVMTMDFSPRRVSNRQPTPYTVIRTRDEYIEAFAKFDFKLIYEFNLSRLAVKIYNFISRIVGKAYSYMQRYNNIDKPRLFNPINEKRLGIIRFFKGALLRLMYPIDYLLSPWPFNRTDMRILVFRKL